MEFAMSVKVRLVVYGFLLLLFLVGFVFRIESSFIGPRSNDAVDDLAIQGAWIDGASNTLYLVTEDRWARLDLTKVQRQNMAFAQDVYARGDNFLHWKSFQDGPPQLDLSRLERVAVLTGTHASFNYMRDHGVTWRVPALDFEHAAAPPSGYRRALFRSDAEGSREYAKPWFKSYLLTSLERGSDERFGVQFFFHPDYRYRLAYADPFLLFMWGPSFLALWIAVPLTMENKGRIVPPKPYAISAALHTLSSSMCLTWYVFRKALAAAPPPHYHIMFIVVGYFILGSLLFIRKQRESGSRSSVEALP